jgi:hypothetical protein
LALASCVAPSHLLLWLWSAQVLNKGCSRQLHCRDRDQVED